MQLFHTIFSSSFYPRTADKAPFNVLCIRHTLLLNVLAMYILSLDVISIFHKQCCLIGLTVERPVARVTTPCQALLIRYPHWKMDRYS